MRSPGFVCAGTSDPSVCVGLPFYKNWQSHQLCVLHFPGKKNLKLFQECADAKLDRDDFNFDGVWFPEELSLDFEDREFASDVIFSNCTINGKVSFRKCVFHQKAKFIAFWRLSWWYWLASGYGERAFRAFIVILGIWLLFAVIFTRVGFVVSDKNSLNNSDVTQSKYETWGRPLNFPRALTYTAGVMTFQKPEPRPQTNTAQALVLLATVLGPLQAALLALAIRRKFIR